MPAKNTLKMSWRSFARAAPSSDAIVPSAGSMVSMDMATNDVVSATSAMNSRSERAFRVPCVISRAVFPERWRRRKAQASNSARHSTKTSTGLHFCLGAGGVGAGAAQMRVEQINPPKPPVPLTCEERQLLYGQDAKTVRA